MTVDPQVIAQQASRTNVVPSILWALGMGDQAYGGDQFENEIYARQAATKLQELVTQHGTIEAALSMLKFGSADAYEHSNHPAAGFVNGVLGLAGSRADYALEHFTPTDPTAFHAHAEDVHGVFDSMASLGGVVTPEAVQKFAFHVQKYKPRTKDQPTHLPDKPPMPSGPPVQHVAEFQAQAAGLGIDPDHFNQNFGFASSLNRKMAGKPLTLDEFAPMGMMNQQQIMVQVQSQPHPVYPNLTLGQYHAAYDTAVLHSWRVGRFPLPSEAARFAAAGMDNKAVGQHYADKAAAKAQPTAPQPQQPQPQQSKPEAKAEAKTEVKAKEAVNGQ